MNDEPDQEEYTQVAPQHVADIVPKTLQKRVRSVPVQPAPSTDPETQIAEQKASTEATMDDDSKAALADHLQRIAEQLSPEDEN